MAHVMVALYDDYRDADQVRIELVDDGFPTDRVELTAAAEPGQAGAEPGDSFPEQVAKYFDTLFAHPHEEYYAEFFAEGVRRGGSAIAVHPRSDEEIQSAERILQRHRPVDIEQRSSEWRLEQYASPECVVRGGVCISTPR